jgi:hypothetical protein
VRFSSILRTRLGRAPTDGELYIALFLGAGGAGKLIKAASSSNASAAQLFPAAARANRSIFYDRAGQARSASEVYSTLTGRYEVARLNTARAAAQAAAAQPKPAAATPDPAGMTQAFAALQPQARANDSDPAFHALFRTGERHEAVAPRINQLWAAPSVPAQAQVVEVQATPAAQAPANGRPLDLFQDMPPNVRGLFTGRG